MFLEKKNLPHRKLPLPLQDFELRNGCLYKVTLSNDKVLSQIVVPRTLQKVALALSHSLPLAGHPGIYKTYRNLRGMFCFPKMLSKGRSFVSACHT